MSSALNWYYSPLIVQVLCIISTKDYIQILELLRKKEIYIPLSHMSEQNQNYIIHPLMIKVFLYFFLRFSVLSLLPQQDFVVEFVSQATSMHAWIIS